MPVIDDYTFRLSMQDNASLPIKGAMEGMRNTIKQHGKDVSTLTSFYREQRSEQRLQNFYFREGKQMIGAFAFALSSFNMLAGDSSRNMQILNQSLMQGFMAFQGLEFVLSSMNMGVWGTTIAGIAGIAAAFVGYNSASEKADDATRELKNKLNTLKFELQEINRNKYIENLESDIDHLQEKLNKKVAPSGFIQDIGDLLSKAWKGWGYIYQDLKDWATEGNKPAESRANEKKESEETLNIDIKILEKRKIIKDIIDQTNKSWKELNLTQDNSLDKMKGLFPNIEKQSAITKLAAQWEYLFDTMSEEELRTLSTEELKLRVIKHQLEAKQQLSQIGVMAPPTLQMEDMEENLFKRTLAENMREFGFTMESTANLIADTMRGASMSIVDAFFGASKSIEELFTSMIKRVAAMMIEEWVLKGLMSGIMSLFGGIPGAAVGATVGASRNFLWDTTQRQRIVEAIDEANYRGKG